MSRHPGARQYDHTTPTSFWREGATIGPAAIGPKRGQTAVVLKNLGPLPEEGRICSFLDTLEVRWQDGTIGTVKIDVFLN